MDKWNLGGMLFFCAVFIFTVFTIRDDLVAVILNPLSYVPLLAAFVILGLDRWAGETKAGAFVLSVLWALFFGFAAFTFFSVTFLFGFAAGFGHGGQESSNLALWYLFSYLAVSFAFAFLSLANIVKFFVKLFSLPKLGKN